jgi:glycosyltransferase involved in cell wall biosynthesis
MEWLTSTEPGMSSMSERLTLTKPVDVIILTKNSERLLRKCIDSVYQNVPLSRLIVVDGYSTDNTIRIVKEFQERHGNVIFVQDKGTRGSARQVGINKVRSDWFMFVDSDVVLSRNWFAKAEKLIRDDIGAIWGIEIWSVLTKTKILKLFERATLKIFEKRGGLHDLLVRRKAIDGIKVPYQLHTYEDAYIKSWICGKGYRVIGVYEPYCLHFRSDTVWTIRHFSFMGDDLKFAARHPSLLLPYAFHTCIEAYLIALHICKPGQLNQKIRSYGRHLLAVPFQTIVYRRIQNERSIRSFMPESKRAQTFSALIIQSKAAR